MKPSNLRQPSPLVEEGARRAGEGAASDETPLPPSLRDGSPFPARGEG